MRQKKKERRALISYHLLIAAMKLILYLLFVFFELSSAVKNVSSSSLPPFSHCVVLALFAASVTEIPFLKLYFK